MKKYLLITRRSFTKGSLIFIFSLFIFLVRRSFSVGGFTIILLLPSSSFSQGVWTWVNGDTIKGYGAVYGTQGVPAPGNFPPSVYEPCEWTDLQGNFWLFGGLDSSFNAYSDLWKYNPVTNEWTWVKGPGIKNDGGTYGTLGIPAISNQPPAKAWGIASWVDLNGDLWMYGGSRLGGISFSDLWKYNIAGNTWTWVQGSSYNNILTQYGIQGIPSTLNTPGGRWECSATWADSTGNLWLFGGYFGNGTIPDDLWKYTMATNQWTWMSGMSAGNQSGHYGSIHVPDTANKPGARAAYCSWKDLNNKFWFFGGANFSGNENFNDMWKYDPANNGWVWMSGTNLIANTGNYGRLCNSATGFYPGARFENRVRWIDDCGKFWMYGGNNILLGCCNDMWNFDPVSLKWTLVSGSAVVNASPVYGTLGVPAATNQPGSREGGIAWKRKDGTLYLFGGRPGGGVKPLNDLWRFQPDVTCPASSGATPSFSLGNDTAYCGPFTRVLSTNNTGTQWSTGVTASQITVTMPGKYWATINNACGLASDTIIFSPGTIPVAGTITRGRDSICQGSGITSLLNSNSNGGNLQWQSSTDGINFANINNATTSSYTTPPLLPQTTSYRLVVSKNCGSDTSNTVVVHIIPAPVAVFNYVIKGNQVTFNSAGSSANVVTYQWDFGDSTTSNAVNPVHNYAGNADSFYVCLTVYNNSNCSYTLCQYINLLNTGIANIAADNFIHLYPNPANNTINLSVDGLTGNYQLKIYNVLGQNVGGIHESPLHTWETIPIDLSTLAQGEYELVLVNDKEYYSKRFVKIK